MCGLDTCTLELRPLIVDYMSPHRTKRIRLSGNAKISIDKMKKDWKLEKGTEERSFACQCPNPGQDQYQNLDFFPSSDPDSNVEAVQGERKCRSE